MVTRCFAATLALFLAAAPAAAQDAAQDAPPVTQEEMEAALGTRADEVRADRATVERVLADERVESVAREHGIDLDGVRQGAATLEGEELARVAREARDVEDRLALAQDSLTISTTMIIIGLLAIIVLVLIL